MRSESVHIYSTQKDDQAVKMIEGVTRLGGALSEVLSACTKAASRL